MGIIRRCRPVRPTCSVCPTQRPRANGVPHHCQRPQRKHTSVSVRASASCHTLTRRSPTPAHSLVCPRPSLDLPAFIERSVRRLLQCEQRSGVDREREHADADDAGLFNLNYLT